MRFAGDDELDRALRVEQQPAEAITVAHEQRGPLVGGEAARKADRQDVRVQYPLGTLLRFFWRNPTLPHLPPKARLGELYQALPSLVEAIPQLAIRDLADSLP